MKLTDIIKEIAMELAESPELIDETVTAASKEANARGLKYAGFGRWKDSKGTIVAKTSGGKLAAFTALSKRSPRQKSSPQKLDNQKNRSTANLKSTKNFFKPKASKKRKTALKKHSALQKNRQKYKTKRTAPFKMRKNYYRKK